MDAATKRQLDNRTYGRRHQELRARFKPMVLAGGVRCAKCGDPIMPGDLWDLGHVPGSRERYRGPEHRRCNRATSVGLWQREPPAPEPERDGLEPDDQRWDVPWLKALRRVPKDSTWPRLMTVPHQRRAGRWVRSSPVGLRPGRVAGCVGGSAWSRPGCSRSTRRGALVWETAVLSMARQLGKSWLLRELVLWRIHQGDRFGEPQDVLHTGKDWRFARRFSGRPGVG